METIFQKTLKCSAQNFLMDNRMLNSKTKDKTHNY